MSSISRTALAGSRRLLATRQPFLSSRIVARPFHNTTTRLSSDRPKSTEGLQPKILSTNPPERSEQSEEVQRHNSEVDERHDKAVSQVATDDTQKDKEGEGKKHEKGAKDGQGKERKQPT